MSAEARECTHRKNLGRSAARLSDHLPILGPTDIDGLLVATGYFRSGILLTSITARLIREWITEQRVSVEWDRCSPLRFASDEAAAARHAPA